MMGVDLLLVVGGDGSLLIALFMLEIDTSQPLTEMELLYQLQMDQQDTHFLQGVQSFIQ